MMNGCIFVGVRAKSVGIAILLMAVTTPSIAQRNLKDIPVPDPELERKSFQVADGFEVNLFAADPVIAKPIQMNFDPQGRLWIVSSEVYPHIKPGQAEHDKVLVLEDRDGDGRAEKTTVFADGLLIPTGIEPGDGGVYVANSTELLHLSDTDGDGKADRRRVVLSGFGTEDTHHILHTLRWGPDGMLYFNQSIYIHSHIETPYGVRRLNGGGIWQFRPETLRLNVYLRGLINSWGHHFDQWGQSFATDGAGGEGINYVVPGAAYRTAVGVPRIVQGLNLGSPKYCGLEVVSGRHLPDDWQGNLLTNDFRGHRVCRFIVSDDGSGFAAREQRELIKTKHVAFRPIDIKMGPDGAIYIADWYNPIIQHGEVDFRDPRRDHTHGRIWRVTCKGRPLVPRPKLINASTGELLDALKSPEGWTRHNAKRVLKERGVKAVSKELADWTARLDPQDKLVERHRLEALWTYQSLDVPEPALLRQLLLARNARVRAAATRVIQHWYQQLPDAFGLLTRQIDDEHPRVRLEAVRVLGKIPHQQSVEIALRALDDPVDRFLDYALWLTSRERRDDWLPLAERGQLNFSGNAQHLAFALKSVGSSSVAPLLVKLLQTGKLAENRQDEALEVITSLGGPQELKVVFDLTANESTSPSRRAVLLDALESAVRSRKARPAGDLSAVGKLLESDDVNVSSRAARLAGLWKLETLRGNLTDLAEDPSGKQSVRLAALDGLAALGGSASGKLLEQFSGSQHAPIYRAKAVVALMSIDVKTAIHRAVDVLAVLRPEDDPASIFAEFLRRKQAPVLLAKELTGKKLPEDVAKIGLRTLESSGRKLPELDDALRKAGGISVKPKTLTAAEMRKLVDQVQAQGNAARGELVYRQHRLSCTKCHAIAGAGGRVGPDLVSLGASAQVDYLVESLLEPNKKVKENYHSVVVATLKGRVFSGIKVRQTDRDLLLRDAEDRIVVIPLKSIDEQAPGASIMPTGLTEKLTRGELVDLVRFLSKLGRVGDFAVSKARIVRRWRVLDSTPEAAFRLRRTSYATAANDDPAFLWNPRYSTVAGVLPLSEFPELRIRNRTAANQRGMAFIRCDLNVTTAGRCGLLFNSTQGLNLWINSEPVDAKSKIIVELPVGQHRLTIAVDLNNREQALRLELTDVAGSKARVQVVSGK